MSDPMTNTEVEDVLSSIRRLVSDEKRAETPEAEEPTQDRLVLTPALRVSEDEDASQSDEESELASPDDGFEFSHFDPDAVEPSGDALEDTEGQDQDGPFESAPDVWPAEDVPSVSASNSVDIELEIDLETSGRPEAVTADEVVEEDKSLGDKIAALETLIAGQSEQWEPDDTGTDPYAGTEAPAIQWVDVEEPDADQAMQDLSQDTPENAEQNSEFMQDGLATPEDHRETVQDNSEPSEHAPEPSASDSDSHVFAGDDDVLDEEALREIVSAIVREELQGALGERITRNVRKLVRREIHRALAAQELD